MAALTRRSFLKETAVLSAGMSVLLDRTAETAQAFPPEEIRMPTRRMGPLDVSRLIIGGNPFSYIAHAEPLVYSRELFRQYFTHEKVVETIVRGESRGINTFLGRVDENVVAFLDLHEKATGRRIPWLAQTAAKPMNGATPQQILDNIQYAADNGAAGIYFQGESADFLVKEGRTDEIATYLGRIRDLGLIVGVGGHEIETIEACEAEGFEPDFYMKTFNRLEYKCPNFEKTKAVMSAIERPWIAFKVLAAGRLRPEEGFAAAIEAGAHFLCVGMFDFQVDENVDLACSLFGSA